MFVRTVLLLFENFEIIIGSDRFVWFRVCRQCFAAKLFSSIGAILLTAICSLPLDLTWLKGILRFPFCVFCLAQNALTLVSLLRYLRTFTGMYLPHVTCALWVHGTCHTCSFCHPFLADSLSKSESSLLISLLSGANFSVIVICLWELCSETIWRRNYQCPNVKQHPCGVALSCLASNLFRDLSMWT